KEILRNVKANSGGDKPLAVVIINYESAWRMEKELLAFAPDLIIADEGHKIKEGRTSQSKCLHHLGDSARFRLLLTGTVITNKEIDVWSQYRFVDPRIFGKSFFAFRNHFFEMSGYGLHTPVFREMYREEFLKRLHHVAFRITKEEALDLPETTEEIRYVELEPKARKLYAELAKESYAELETGEVSAVNILTKILRLSQLTGGHMGDDEGKVHLVSNAKLDALADILDVVMEEERKLVVMARFVPELDDIIGLLDKRHIGYAQVRGGVKDRTEEIRRFQEDEDCRVFVGQIAAAGLGITLTSSDVMVFYSMDYSMSNFTQAQARIHRIGQKSTCHYLYLVAKGTIDERVLTALRGKMDLARMLVDDYRKGLMPF
ncbi:MAG: DEAD/DEAH box helicase, partial [Blautia sp.]|nr:DEAD/DEAH box helicase [Blautia sp.]